MWKKSKWLIKNIQGLDTCFIYDHIESTTKVGIIKKDIYKCNKLDTRIDKLAFFPIYRKGIF